MVIETPDAAGNAAHPLPLDRRRVRRGPARADRARLQPGDRAGDRPRPARRGRRGRRRGRGRAGRLPGLARHAAHRPQPDLLRLPRARLRSTARRWRALITRDHGKTFPDALGEVLRGLETIEFACGLPVHMAGMNTPNVAHQGRRVHAPPAARRGRRDHARSTSRPWSRCGSTRSRSPAATRSSGSRPPTPRARPSSRPSCGRRPGCRTASSTSSTAAARRSTRSVEHPGIKAIQFVGSTAGRHATSTRPGPGRQARRRVHRRQERDDRPARRGPRAGRRRRGGRRLRLGRRALHGPDPGHRRRRHGRPAPADDRRADRASSRSAPAWSPASDMGPLYSAEHRDVGHRLDRQGRGRGRRARRRRPAVPPRRATPTASSSGSPSSTT